jgi:hypothetical protein
LQRVGTKHIEEQAANPESSPQANAAPSAEMPAPVIASVEQVQTGSKPVQEPIPIRPPSNKPLERAEVEVVDITTSAEGAEKPRAEAKIILKARATEKKPATKRRRTTTRYSRGVGTEDRARSAELVDMLDGPASRRSGGSTYNTSRTYTTQRSYREPTYTTAHHRGSVREDRSRSAELVDMLDGQAYRQNRQSGQRLVSSKPTSKRDWANEVPMASTQTTHRGIEETTFYSQTPTRTYATAAPQEKPTYVAPSSSSRPAWDVNAGAGAD